jgi:hypothetical protein
MKWGVLIENGFKGRAKMKTSIFLLSLRGRIGLVGSIILVLALGLPGNCFSIAKDKKKVYKRKMKKYEGKDQAKHAKYEKKLKKLKKEEKKKAKEKEEETLKKRAKKSLEKKLKKVKKAKKEVTKSLKKRAADLPGELGMAAAGVAISATAGVLVKKFMEGEASVEEKPPSVIPEAAEDEGELWSEPVIEELPKIPEQITEGFEIVPEEALELAKPEEKPAVEGSTKRSELEQASLEETVEPTKPEERPAVEELPKRPELEKTSSEETVEPTKVEERPAVEELPTKSEQIPEKVETVPEKAAEPTRPEVEEQEKKTPRGLELERKLEEVEKELEELRQGEVVKEKEAAKI